MINPCNCSDDNTFNLACAAACAAKKGLTGSENFTEDKKEEKDKTALEKAMPVLKLMMLAFAIYLSFRCKQKVDPLDLGMAIFFSPCYILYRLALVDNQCAVPLFDMQ